MSRRRQWRAPNNPTRAARQVWAHVFPGEPWPRGWRVAWVGFMRGALGLTLWDERRVLLSYGDARRERFPKGPVATLVHEFVHIRCPKLRHGKEFRQLEAEFLRRIGLNPSEEEATP